MNSTSNFPQPDDSWILKAGSRRPASHSSPPCVPGSGRASFNWRGTARARLAFFVLSCGTSPARMLPWLALRNSRSANKKFQIMKLIPLFSLAALLIASTAAQDSAPVFYAESFRKTPIRITEDKFEVKLTADNPNYKQRLRDSSGTERFEFTIVPRRPEGGANGQITSW